MTDETEPQNSDKLAHDSDKEAIVEKVSEYMGTPPDNLNNDQLLKENKDQKITIRYGGDTKEPESSNQEQNPALTSEPDELSDAEIDKAVDEIAAAESDEVLEAEDAQNQAESAMPPKRGFKNKLKNFFTAWWGNRRIRRLTLIGAGAVFVLLLALPPTRYFMLNTAGVRASASVIVIDEETLQPLKNVNVKIGSSSSQTDDDGKAKLTKVRLGSNNLVVEKRAFAKVERKITVGLGSNPLGSFELTPVGSQYEFEVTDLFSGKPIVKAEATAGEASAFSDEKGKIVLTVDESDEAEIKVTIAADTYRSEELTLDASSQETKKLQLVPGRKQVFVSKRSGKFDLFKIDVDGKNEERLLAGTGTEREDMVISVHPTEEIVAYVSTRDNLRNKDGFLLSQLYLINIKTAEATLVSSSERVQVVDWIGDRLIYVKIAEGASAANPKRHRLMSYHYKNSESKELASANYFNDVLAANGVIYYAPSAAYQPASSAGLFKSGADGSGKQTIISGEVWNMLRTEYERLSISVAGDWYSYKLGESSANKLSGPPSILRSRLYINNQANSRSLWVDERDGKGVLLAYDISKKADEIIHSQTGLSNPVRWLNNNYVIYRINSGQETADYVKNLDGGEPKKIKDVTNSGGLDSWYYY